MCFTFQAGFHDACISSLLCVSFVNPVCIPHVLVARGWGAYVMSGVGRCVCVDCSEVTTGKAVETYAHRLQLPPLPHCLPPHGVPSCCLMQMPDSMLSLLGRQVRRKCPTSALEDR